MPDNLIPNPNYNPAIPVSGTNQPVIFSDPNTVINPLTGQTAISAAGGTYPITPTSLAPATPITLPVVPPDTTNYTGEIAGGVALANAAVAPPPTPPTPPASTGGLDDLWTNWLAGQTPPPSIAGAYTAQGGTVPTGGQLDTMGQQVITDETALQGATDELNDLNTQMQVLNQEAQAIPERLQQEATGRGITAGGLAPIQTAQLRDIYLRQLPLSGQILIAQGKQLAAQGKVNLSQRKLELAQAKFDRYFDLVVKDMENKYNYDKSLRDKAFEFATLKEQRQFETQQKEADRIYQEGRDNLKLQQDWVEKAVANSQGDLAAKISALDVKSPTFATDLATLQGQIKVVDPEIKALRAKYIDAGILDTDTREQATAKIVKNSKIYRDEIRPPQGPQPTQTEKETAILVGADAELRQTIGPGGFVDINVYRSLRSKYATKGASITGFDSAYSDYLSPSDRAKFGIGTAVGFSATGEYTGAGSDPFEQAVAKALKAALEGK